MGELNSRLLEFPSDEEVEDSEDSEADEEQMSRLLPYEDNSNFSLKQDELLVHWANRKPEDWR